MSRKIELPTPLFGITPLGPLSTRVNNQGYVEEINTRAEPPWLLAALGWTRTPAIGAVTSKSEYSYSRDGRPCHFTSTVYKSPYGKNYRFTSSY